MMERMTELEAINRMLLGIQLAPVASVDELDVYSEGMIARSILRQVSLEVIMPGWNFNTRCFTLVPDETSGRIPAPARTIDVFVSQYNPVEYYVDADGFLTNMATDSNVFTSPQTFYAVLGFSWAELPAPVQMLILHKARLAFKTEMNSELGADTQVIMGDIQRADALVKSWDTGQKRRSMLDTLRMRQHTSRNIPR